MRTARVHSCGVIPLVRGVRRSPQRLYGHQRLPLGKVFIEERKYDQTEAAVAEKSGVHTYCN